MHAFRPAQQVLGTSSCRHFIHVSTTFNDARIVCLGRSFHTSPPSSTLRQTFRSSTRLRRTSTSTPTTTNARSSRYSSTSAFEGIEPVELAYDLVEPGTEKARDQCLVICHGLFGSKQNWRSLAKAFAQKLGMSVYTVDLRNHGASPHAEPHTYAAMATDLNHLCIKLGLKGINLLGHSMGGKAVMAFALTSGFNKELRSLISVDMSPAVGRISPEFQAYTEGMRRVDQAGVKTKSEADKILQEVEPVLGTRQFLLTNTRTTPSGTIAFRIPLDLLDRAIPSIGDFPYPPPSPGEPDSSTGTWAGPTLFLKGEHSKYINRKNIPIAQLYFPRMNLEVLPTGHWVHAEAPGETVRLVREFIVGVDRELGA